jgi:hypothetical protein
VWVWVREMRVREVEIEGMRVRGVVVGKGHEGVGVGKGDEGELCSGSPL